MKALKLLILLSIASFTPIFAKEDTVQCYCSDKCGPRNIGDRNGDMPKFDKELGQCFCQQRDKDNYLKNKCDLKEKTDPSKFTSYCDLNNNKSNEYTVA